PPTIEWRDGVVRLIDQRRLPEELTMLDCRSVDELCEAISGLAIRGAPALGAAGAMGVALAAATGEPLEQAAVRLKATRPTAANLAWGVERALAAPDPAAEAVRIAADDVARNRRLGAHGAELLPEDARVLTHCNTGSLACVGYGTALGVVRAAHEAGRRPSVWVDETRPVLQGARLTAWELDRLGIPATLVADVMAGSLMAGGEVDCVVVGADRIAANGDTANKVGTYPLAVLAHQHGVADTPPRYLWWCADSHPLSGLRRRRPGPVRSVRGRAKPRPGAAAAPRARQLPGAPSVRGRRARAVGPAQVPQRTGNDRLA